ncbi:MAG: hypothetical protein Q8M54_01555 [Desulfobaccales bacterium]|nr:hypothetical protein [Desulfobaccales bacterium]
MSLHHKEHPVAGVVEIVRVLKTQGRAWIYELNRDASLRDIKNYAREEKLPSLPVYLVFNFGRWPSALKEVNFAQVFHPAGVPEWQWQQVQLRELLRILKIFFSQMGLKNLSFCSIIAIVFLRSDG